VGDLTGGHTGKIFCVAADRTKVISCGEDMRICVWDFAAGVEGVEGIRSGW
jgi:F-box and WD-40 domain protein 1/11